MAVMVGAFARGDAFPSQREMARTYGVPNSTLSDWLNSPEAERFGIVRRTEGRRKAVPFLNTYRTMCIAPEPGFKRVLEDIRELQLAA